MVPQLDTLDAELSVQENLWLYGRFFDLPRAEAKRRAAELLEFAQLTDRADSVVENLSGGMKRRLSIARSLINEPELLLLDEPTTGLDPQARHVLWDRLYRLKQQGVTLVLTTHYMDEAEQLCDRLVVMDQGRIVAEGSPRSLIEQYSTREVLELRFAAGTNEAHAPQLGGIGERQELLPDRVLVYAHDGEAALAETHAPRPASPRARWCAAPAWKTCSCCSPAAAWWTDGARMAHATTPGRAARGQLAPRQLPPAVEDERAVVARAAVAVPARPRRGRRLAGRSQHRFQRRAGHRVVRRVRRARPAGHHRHGAWPPARACGR